MGKNTSNVRLSQFVCFFLVLQKEGEGGGRERDRTDRQEHREKEKKIER